MVMAIAKPSSNLNKCLFYALGLGPGPGKTGIVPKMDILFEYLPWR